MDNLQRDIQRLEFITEDPLGLEGFGAAARIKDFLSYYFTRFLINTRHAFKDFSRSEIEAFGDRYRRQVELTLSDPLLSMKGVVVPIPKGMVGSYRDVLETLTEVLSVIHVETLKDDVANILQAAQASDVSLLHKPNVTKGQFDKALSWIGKLYVKGGLTHSPAENVLRNLPETKEVYLILIGAAKEFYPQAIEMAKLVDSIDKVHNDLKISPADGKILSTTLMSAAYRVSLFAIVMEHIQDMEHTFLQGLKALLDLSARGK